VIDSIIISLLTLNGVIVAAILGVFLLRPLVRYVFGSVAAYRLWLMVPFACVGMIIAANLPATSLKWQGEPALAQVDRVWDGVAPLHTVPAKRVPVEIWADIAALVKGQAVKSGFLFVWVIGGLSVFGLIMVRQYKLRQTIGVVTYDEAGYYTSEDATISPMLVGVIAPKVIVPDNFDACYSRHEQALILAHERAHLRAGDHIVNAVIVFFQCLNWFNPFIYSARPKILMDQELACDARVLTLRPDEKKAYMRALLKAQHISYDGLLKAAWKPAGAHPLVARIMQLGRPVDGVLSGVKRRMAIVGLLIIIGSAVVFLSPFQRVYHIADGSLGIASADERRLIELVQAGRSALVQGLLETGLDPNVNIPPYGTPLIIAARNGDTDLMEILVRAGADVNYAARGQGFPLLAAVESGHERAAKYLLSLGARSNARALENDASPLVIAAKQGNTKLITALITYGADPNMTVDDEGTALIAASMAGQAKAVDLLVKKGADINQQAYVERQYIEGGRNGGRYHEPTTARIEAQRGNHKTISDYFMSREKVGLSDPPP
jgi:beta-lactamase regulating signal transducer with metallopeptidase domain